MDKFPSDDIIRKDIRCQRRAALHLLAPFRARGRIARDITCVVILPGDGLRRDKRQLRKGLFRPQGDLQTEPSQAKRLVKPRERQSVLHEGFSVIEVGIVRTMADDHVCRVRRRQEVGEEIVAHLNGDFQRQLKSPVRQEDGNPVEKITEFVPKMCYVESADGASWGVLMPMVEAGKGPNDVVLSL